MEVRLAGPGDRAAWDAFVAARPEADPLQGWAWGEANATAGERPVRLLATGEDGTVRGLAQLLVERDQLLRAHRGLDDNGGRRGPLVVVIVVVLVRLLRLIVRLLEALGERTLRGLYVLRGHDAFAHETLAPDLTRRRVVA